MAAELAVFFDGDRSRLMKRSTTSFNTWKTRSLSPSKSAIRRWQGGCLASATYPLTGVAHGSSGRHLCEGVRLAGCWWLPAAQAGAIRLHLSRFTSFLDVFFLAPSLIALVLSLFRWDGINDPRFVLARNYGRLVSDKVFAQAATNTAIYAIASLLIVLPLALVLAVLLNAKSLRFSNVWRAMYFTPVVTSTVAITLVFQILYSRETGLLNAPLIYLGLEPIYWLGDRSWAKVAIIILIAWRSTGLLTIYFLAGLQSIPAELYEAASIDGASMLQKFFSITIPMLRPIILFVSIIVLLSSIQIFDESRILILMAPRRTGERHHARRAISL